MSLRAIDWMNAGERSQICEEIYGSREELFRKQESFAQYEIYNDRIERYVRGYLESQLSAETVKKMPIISSVNIGRKVVKSEASLYKTAPERIFSNISEQDQAAIDAVYFDGKFNVKLQKSNEYFKLQNQGLIQIVPINGKISMRVLFPHNYDVIPDDENPEVADSYIISTFDRSRFIQSDGNNQRIADQDDYKKSLDRFTVWSKEYNFVMNGHGEIITGIEDKDLINHIGILPFYDVTSDKDFEYFVRQGSTLADFTVQYNAALSDLQQIVRLQGYAQGIISGPSNLLPAVLQTGPNVIIHLPTDPSTGEKCDFKFVTPNPNIADSLRALENLVANFLSSRGVDTNIIQGTLNNGTGKAYSSGLERLLAMVDRFEASRSDIDLFSDAESKIFEIVKTWMLYLSGSDLLEKKYQVTSAFDSVDLSVVYARPENIQTDADKLAYIQGRVALGVSDKLDAIMFLDDLDEDEAQEKLDEMNARDLANPDEVIPAASAPPIPMATVAPTKG